MYDYTANVNHYNSKYNTTDGSVGLSYSYIVFTKRVSLAAYHRYDVKTRCSDDHPRSCHRGPCRNSGQRPVANSGRKARSTRT